MRKRVLTTLTATIACVLASAAPALAGPLPKAITDLVGNPGCC